MEAIIITIQKTSSLKYNIFIMYLWESLNFIILPRSHPKEKSMVEGFISLDLINNFHWCLSNVSIRYHIKARIFWSFFCVQEDVGRVFGEMMEKKSHQF